MADLERFVEDWTPLTKEEIQAERAEQLLFELERVQAELDDHNEERKRLKDEIKSLKRQIKTAKRLSVKQRARINTLNRKWREQWVYEYDRFRADGKDKKQAAALAWSRIKVHCKKDDEGVWECPEWSEVIGRSRAPKPKKRGKKSAKKKASKKKSSKKK